MKIWDSVYICVTRWKGREGKKENICVMSSLFNHCHRGKRAWITFYFFPWVNSHKGICVTRWEGREWKIKSICVTLLVNVLLIRSCLKSAQSIHLLQSRATNGSRMICYNRTPLINANHISVLYINKSHSYLLSQEVCQ